MDTSFSLFFRNDDLGWDRKKFDLLMEIFVNAGHKLNAAAIPVATTETYPPGSLSHLTQNLEIHTHGYSHLDHESEGKKAEFGSSRDPESVRRELLQGRLNLESAFSNLYYPAFTPPWNRFDAKFLPQLKEAGYKMLSRDQKPTPGFDGIEQLNVDIDLHTRRDNVRLSAEQIWDEVQAKTQSQRTVGIMLHHKHMKDEDYQIIAEFLALLNTKACPSYFMSELESIATQTRTSTEEHSPESGYENSSKLSTAKISQATHAN